MVTSGGVVLLWGRPWGQRSEAMYFWEGGRGSGGREELQGAHPAPGEGSAPT